MPIAADQSDEESDPSPKRARTDPFGGRVGFTDDDPNAQLDAMLRDAGQPAAVDGFKAGAGVPSGSLNRAAVGGGLGQHPLSGFGASAGAGFDMPGMTGLGQDEPRVETSRMDFSKIARETPTTPVNVQKELVEPLMTPEHRRILFEETGANVEWAPETAQVILSGSAEQVKKAQRLLARVMMHSRWGYREEKVRRLLKPRKIESVLCRLSPMNTLRPIQRTLTAGSPVLSIGKDKQNDCVVKDALMSRQHCVLELDDERGAVYVLDCSTNGTFLNGVRLPSKTIGKVLLSHGDELLFKDPKSGEQEFGYIVNLDVLHMQAEQKLEAPRRILTADEISKPAYV